MEEARSPKEKPTIIERLQNVFGPIMGGLLLDFVDFATIGPIGIYAGFIIGFAVGFWIGSIYKLPKRRKLIIACVAGIYCTLPMTEFIPVATVLGATARFLKSS